MSRTKEQKAELLERYERASELPMAFLALLLVPLLVIPLLADLGDGLDTSFFAIDVFIWGVFFLDISWRLFLAPEKLRYLRANWIDATLVVLFFLRPLRALRSVRLLRLLRLSALGVVIGVIWRRVERVLAHRHFGFAILFFALVTLVIAGIVFELERGHDDASITSFGDAAWWAIVTITTVGYGETYPVTGAGRALAAVLMIVGISLFGVVAANLASIFVKQDDKEANDQRERIEAKLDVLTSELASLKAQLRELEPTGGTAAGGTAADSPPT